MEDDVLTEFGISRNQQAPTKLKSFVEFLGNTDPNSLTPQEYNAARERYKSDYAPIYASSGSGSKSGDNPAGPREKYQAKLNEFITTFDRHFPLQKEDQWTDVLGNYGHAAATGVVKGMRWVSDFAGEENPVSHQLTHVIYVHQSSMTATEKILSARSIQRVQDNQALGIQQNMWENIISMRMTGAIEALVLPMLLMTLVILKMRRRWAWPSFKMRAFRVSSWPSRQKMVWSPMSKEQAQAHPLYGIKWGLIVFAVFEILQPIVIWGGFKRELFEAQVSMAEFFTQSTLAPIFVASLLITLVRTGVICWAMFTKHPRFRAIATWLLVLFFPANLLAALIFPVQGVGPWIAQVLIVWLIFGSLWVAYVQRSHRVRVTFEHMAKVPFMPEAPLVVAPTVINEETMSSDSTGLTAAVVKPNDPLKQPVREEELWAEALREFESADRKSGLWAKSYAQHQGQDAAAKASYLTERVEQLRARGWAGGTAPSPEHEQPS